MYESEPLEVASFSPSFRELAVDRAMLEKDLGYRRGNAPDPVRELIDEVLPQVPTRVTIQCGFRILPPGSVTVGRNVLSSDRLQFAIGPILARELKESVSLALFVSTAGPQMGQWSSQLMAGGDLMKGYIVDAVASEVVERTSEWLESRIEEHVKARGWSVTNRYSPGYCDWPVDDQHKLFSLLPDQFCGISLTPSALMIPVKSMSGVIGLGPDVQRGAYQCSICDLKDCFRRMDEPELRAERQ